MAPLIDQSIVYKSKVEETRQMLSKLRQCGLDIDGYQKELEDIDSNYEKGIKKGYGLEHSVAAMDQAFNIQLCLTGIKKIESLQSNLLREFNDYMQVFNSCEVLEDNINANHFLSEEEIRRMINEITNDIRILNASTPISWHEEKSIIHRTYALAYQIILLEKYTLNSTQLLQHITVFFQNALPFLNKMFMDDLNKLNLNSGKNKEIRVCMNKIESQGLDSSYLNAELLELFVQLNPPYNKEALDNASEVLNQQYLKLQKKKNNLIYDRDLSLESYEDQTRIISRNRKKMIHSLIIYGLSVAAVFGAHKGAVSLTKNKLTAYEYKTVRQIYVEGEQAPLVFEDYQSSKDDSKQIIVHEPWTWNKQIGQQSREVTFYNVEDIEYTDIVSYLDVNLENMESSGFETETKAYLLPEDEYTESYKAVILETQDKQTFHDLTDYEKIDSLNRTFNLLRSILFSGITAIEGLALLLRLRNILKSKKDKKQESNKVRLFDEEIEQLKFEMDEFKKQKEKILKSNK